MNKRFSPDEDEVLIDLVRQHPPLYNVGGRRYKDLVVKNNIWKEIGVAMKKTEKACQTRWKNIRDNYTKRKRELNKGKKTGSARNVRMERFFDKYRNLSFLHNTSIVKRRSLRNLSGSEGSSESQDLMHDSQYSIDIDYTEGSPEQVDVEASLSNQDFASTEEPNDDQSTTVEVTPVNTPKRKRKPVSKEREQVLVEIKRGRNGRNQMVKKLLSQTRYEKKVEETPISAFFKSIALTVEKLHPHLQTRAKVKVLEVISGLEYEQQQIEFDSGSRSSSAGHTTLVPQQNILPTNIPQSTSIAARI